ncbi:hypothetical protein [Actinoplanes friuliensis]|uniref:Uncharacterized protein n=1 Tax=Actinoplanes friuliensis DSM 7358 TaxID=1246995 RepID=U5W5S7_9ACTN|nr:hypothetical protein [Actinoplanes friuliensis]AGZ43286.1 hypothetical protein AFR_25100 [Actinoplanes friuliensis DSM 7358]
MTETTRTPPDRDTYLSRVEGRSTPLTVLTPMPRRWTPLLRGFLFLRHLMGAPADLKKMSFIHFAHWSVISRFPGQKSRSRYAYLLFRSDFNGAWGKYIDAFSIEIPLRMALIWGWSFGFPGALPPGPFRHYIAGNNLPVQHYFSAYPESGVTEIAAALRVRDAYERHLGETAPEEFPEAWRRFLAEVQQDLYSWENGS